jgi:hypothetical protein
VAAASVSQLSSVLSSFASADEAALEELFLRYQCRHIYMDVGSNVGVQIRKLFEPSKYPKAVATHGVYQRFFGPPEERCGVCAIGVEPNPHHSARLAALQQHLRAAGVGVLIFSVAASAADGVAHLALQYADRKDPWQDLGASASEAWRGLRRAGNAKELTVPVRAVDLARLVHSVHARLTRQEANAGGGSSGNSGRRSASAHHERTRGKLLMKLDIEGLEFAVLPAMIRSQAFCTIDALRIEWHTRFWNAKVAAAAADARNLSLTREVGARAMVEMTEGIRSRVRALVPATDCRTELIEADDESYMHDRKPWPVEGSICTRTGHG